MQSITRQFRFKSLVLVLFSLLSAACNHTLFSTKIHYWSSDFSDPTLGEWSYQLNAQGIKVVNLDDDPSNPVARITIEGSEDYLWNGQPTLNRSELQHKPKGVAEGNMTTVKWRFMLPKLFTDSRHEFAYWESDASYQQIMRFNLSANRISFTDNSGVTAWSNARLQANKWYSMQMNIKWSTDANAGQVSIFFDEELVLDKHNTKTLLDNEKAFIQFGILRDQQSTQETIYLDDVESFNTLSK